MTPDELMKPRSSEATSPIESDPVESITELRSEASDVTLETEDTDESQSSRRTEAQPQQIGDYFQLQQLLLYTTVTISIVVAVCVAVFYSISVAANYLLGAIGGIIYLRLLSRNVAQLGRGRSQLGFSRLGIFVGLILVATQVQSLQILPIFFGFISYKVALLVYLVQILTRPSRSQVKP